MTLTYEIIAILKVELCLDIDLFSLKVIRSLVEEGDVKALFFGLFY